MYFLVHSSLLSVNCERDGGGGGAGTSKIFNMSTAVDTGRGGGGEVAWRKERTERGREVEFVLGLLLCQPYRPTERERGREREGWT